MANLSDFFAAASGAPLPYQQLVFGQSKTWTVGVSGRVKVILTGGGGQGGYRYLSGSMAYDAPANRALATGGGAGGYCEKVFDVVAGETYTLVLGAGGDGNFDIQSSVSFRMVLAMEST